MNIRASTQAHNSIFVEIKMLENSDFFMILDTHTKNSVH